MANQQAFERLCTTLGDAFKLLSQSSKGPGKGGAATGKGNEQGGKGGLPVVDALLNLWRS